MFGVPGEWHSAALTGGFECGRGAAGSIACVWTFLEDLQLALKLLLKVRLLCTFSCAATLCILQKC